MNSADSQLSLKLVLPVLLVYGCISALALPYHELFLDEAHHFLVSRDSRSLGDLYHNLRYDGHPRLWGALLFFITHLISSAPAAMQVFHLLLAIAVAFVLLRYGPFPLWTKLLILAGYYFLFEYSWLSRNYALGILLLFVCCRLLRDVRRNWVWIGVLMVSMCCTHLFFTFASIGIMLGLLWQWLRAGGAGRGRVAAPGRMVTRGRVVTPGRMVTGARMVALGLFFLVGLGLALIQAQTPPRAENVNLTPVVPGEWLSAKNIRFAEYGVIRGWLPVPQVNGGRFWNSYWLSEPRLGPVFAGLLLLLLLAFPFLLLRRKVAALIFYYTGVGLLFVFFVVTQMTASRYFGMVYIYFLAAAWMVGDIKVPGRVAGRVFRIGLVSILLIHVAVGIYALEQDLRRPFSQSKNTADYLRGLQAAGKAVVVDGYNCGPMLCAYLGGRVYYLATGAEGSYCVWRRAYFPDPRPSITEEIAQNPGLKQLGPFVLVSNRRLAADSIRSGSGDYRLSALRYFENSITGENYYVYQAEPF